MKRFLLQDTDQVLLLNTRVSQQIGTVHDNLWMHETLSAKSVTIIGSCECSAA